MEVFRRRRGPLESREMSASKQGGASLSGGTLEKTDLAEVLRTAYAARENAQVLVAHRGEERSFWFHRGRLVSASSNREAQHVGAGTAICAVNTVADVASTNISTFITMSRKGMTLSSP